MAAVTVLSKGYAVSWGVAAFVRPAAGKIGAAAVTLHKLVKLSDTPLTSAALVPGRALLATGAADGAVRFHDGNYRLAGWRASVRF